jgi:phosphate acetyltransferase
MMEFIQNIRDQAHQNLKKIVLPEGEEDRVIKAASIMEQEDIVKPILLGNPKNISKKATVNNLASKNIEIINPSDSPLLEGYAAKYFELRKHKGVSPEQSRKIMLNPLYFGAMMLREKEADGAVAGSMHPTGDVLRAAIQIVGLMPKVKVVSSSFLMILKDGKIITFADCAVIPDPDPVQLASIAISSSRIHRQLVGTEPKIAMLSFSTKGSADHPMTRKVIKATELVRENEPGLQIDGELQFDAAFVPEVGQRKAPHSTVAGEANVFIFPDLNAANIGYKMVQRLAGAEAIGPIMQGLVKPYNDLSRGCDIDDIVNVAAICSILSG